MAELFSDLDRASGLSDLKEVLTRFREQISHDLIKQWLSKISLVIRAKGELTEHFWSKAVFYRLLQTAV